MSPNSNYSLPPGHLLYDHSKLSPAMKGYLIKLVESDTLPHDHAIYFKGSLIFCHSYQRALYCTVENRCVIVKHKKVITPPNPTLDLQGLKHRLIINLADIGLVTEYPVGQHVVIEDQIIKPEKLSKHSDIIELNLVSSRSVWCPAPVLMFLCFNILLVMTVVHLLRFKDRNRAEYMR